MRMQGILLFLVASVISMAVAGPAAAKTFEVTRVGDPAPGNCRPDDCSLREAVRAANARAGDDRILLRSEGMYHLAQASSTEQAALDGDLDISDDVTITHHGPGLGAINAHQLDRHFDILAGTTATLDHLALLFGSADPGDKFGSGGAIYVNGTLRLLDSRMSSNHAAGDGGGIHAEDFPAGEGIVVIKRSKIEANDADSDSGAIGIDGERATVKNSSLLRNDAGADDPNGEAGASFIFVQERAVFSRTTIAGNEAPGTTGGIQAHEGEVVLTNSTVANNIAGGVGGGLYGSSGTFELNAVTIVRNVAGEGGGIFNEGVTNVRNSLIARNRLIGGTPSDCDDDDTPVHSLGNNLISAADTCAGFDQPTDLLRDDPKLGFLADNGGATKTVALKRGSPAIGKAANSAPNHDQRGVRRDGNPDIGAFERR